MTEELTKDRLVMPCWPGAVYESGKSRLQSVARENAGKVFLHNYYPCGEGLATSPARHARLRIHYPDFRAETKEVRPRLTTAVP